MVRGPMKDHYSKRKTCVCVARYFRNESDPSIILTKPRESCWEINCCYSVNDGFINSDMGLIEKLGCWMKRTIVRELFCREKWWSKTFSKYIGGTVFLFFYLFLFGVNVGVKDFRGVLISKNHPLLIRIFLNISILFSSYLYLSF